MRRALAASVHQARLAASLLCLMRSSSRRATASAGGTTDRKTERIVSSFHRQAAEASVTSRHSRNPPRFVANTSVMARPPGHAISPNSHAIFSSPSGEQICATEIIARERGASVQRNMHERFSLSAEIARGARRSRDLARQARWQGPRRVRCLAATDRKSRSIIDEIYRDGYVSPLHHAAAIVFASILVEASFDSRPIPVNSPPAECRVSALQRRANT